MKKVIIPIALIILFGSCKDNVSPNNSSVYDYSIDQVKYWVDQYSGQGVRVYSKADTIADLRWLSDNTQVPLYLWNNYRTMKGLSEEIGKWDTANFIIVDTLDGVYHYLRYLSIRSKVILPGSASFVLSSSNIIQSK
jgi:hypothetical protein